jgi:hypothetical protein
MDWSIVNWDAVLAIAQIVGDVGVFLSLIYVGLQIRGEARARRAQTVHQQTAAYNEILDTLAKSRELADIFSRGTRDIGSLDSVEAVQYQMFIGHMLRVFEDTYLQHKRGHLEQSVWQGLEVVIDSALATPGVRAVWQTDFSRMFSKEFRQLVESKLAATPAPDIPGLLRASSPAAATPAATAAAGGAAAKA